MAWNWKSPTLFTLPSWILQASWRFKEQLFSCFENIFSASLFLLKRDLNFSNFRFFHRTESSAWMLPMSTGVATKGIKPTILIESDFANNVSFSSTFESCRTTVACLLLEQHLQGSWYDFHEEWEIGSTTIFIRTGTNLSMYTVAVRILIIDLCTSGDELFGCRMKTNVLDSLRLKRLGNYCGLCLVSS